MENCSFVAISPCHQITFTKHKRLTAVKEEKKILLSLRSKVPLKDIGTICFHHEQSLDIIFSKMIKRCADPFKQHTHPRTRSLRVITMDLYSKLECLQGKAVPGEKLCPSCLIQATKYTAQGERNEQRLQIAHTENLDVSSDPNVAGSSGLQAVLSSASTSTTDFRDTTDETSEPDVSLAEVNAALLVLGETPVKKSKLLCFIN